MAEASGAGKRKSQRDKEMAANLKKLGIERRSGMCPICYGVSGNDTFGGNAVYAHISRHARGWEDEKD